MDLTVNLEDYLLNIRAAAIIVHNNKVLVHRNVNSDHYALLGGRVKIGEDSETTVIREILEEIGKKVEVTGYVATIENFFEMKNKKYHEILFVHKAEFKKEEDRKLEKTIKNAEGKEYLQYEWLEIDKLNNYNLLPNSIKNILQEGKFPIHKINNELNIGG